MSKYLLIIRNQLPFYCGTKDEGRYDMSNACPFCGTGAIRVDPIKLPATRLNDKVSATLKHEIVIPPRLVSCINQTSPNCLRQIKDDQTGLCLQHYQLIGHQCLPRFGNNSMGFTVEMQCPHCRRDGYFNIPKVPLNLSYNQNAPNFPVVETYEHFGNSRMRSPFKESNFAFPLFIVCETIHEILGNEPGVEFVRVSFL